MEVSVPREEMAAGLADLPSREENRKEGQELVQLVLCFCFPGEEDPVLGAVSSFLNPQPSLCPADIWLRGQLRALHNLGTGKA